MTTAERTFPEACDPDARKNYVVDFRAALQGYDLGTVEWSVSPEGPMIDGTSISVAEGRATFYFSAGTAGVLYAVRARATRDDGSGGWIEIVRCYVRCRET